MDKYIMNDILTDNLCFENITNNQMGKMIIGYLTTFKDSAEYMY